MELETEEQIKAGNLVSKHGCEEQADSSNTKRHKPPPDVVVVASQEEEAQPWAQVDAEGNELVKDSQSSTKAPDPVAEWVAKAEEQQQARAAGADKPKDTPKGKVPSLG